MPDFIYRFRGRPETLSALVEYHAVLESICGELRGDRAYAGGVQRVIRSWRRRVVALRGAGLPLLQSKKFGFARNCRPCGAKMEPASAQPCRMRLCPFCHGRRAAVMFEQLRMALAAYQRTGRVGCVVHWQRTGAAVADRIYLDPEANPPAFAAMIKRHQFYGQQTRRRAKRVHGGFQWFNFVPKMLARADEELVGNWVSTDAALWVVGESWQPWRTRHAVEIVRSPSDLELALLVGHACAYPKGWLFGDVNATVALLQALGRKKTFTTYGNLYGSQRLPTTSDPV